MHKLDTRWIDPPLTGAYTRTLVRLTAQVEQRDGYAPDAVEEIQLVTCDRCGAVLISGESLDTVPRHDQWHERTDR